MARPRITDRDRGFQKVLRNVNAAARGQTARVGVLGSDGEAAHGDSTLTVAAVAFFHEMGLGVPERSWLRAWFDENESRIKADISRATRVVIRGRMTADQALSQLAARYVGEIQQRIADGINPPLEQSTIDRKGSDVPLIDTGQLRSAISWVLERGFRQAGGGVTG